jgi:hypothetical protein
VALSRTEQPGFFPKVDKKLLRELEDLRTERLLNPPDPMEAAPPEEEAEPEEEPAQEQDSPRIWMDDGIAYIESDGKAIAIVAGDDE